MNAQLHRVGPTDVWKEWEGQLVIGVFPLRRLLGSSQHSAVFQTEYRGRGSGEAAIKFVPADAVQTEAQLVQWGTAATLSHPHLLKLFDVGRCQLGGRRYLFVVMEMAEQTLADVLPRRPLGVDEIRELLPPTLDALAFLHRNHLVHGQLKPSNILVVNDQLRLASDTIRATGTAASAIGRISPYDPPELRNRVTSTAGDLWGLGVTLVEALTQRMPTWPDEWSETAMLPANLPPVFADPLRRCLSRVPEQRPTITDLGTLLTLASTASVALHADSVEPPTVNAAQEIPAAQPTRSRKRRLPAVAAVVLLSLAGWIGMQALQHHSLALSFEIARPQLQPSAPPTSPTSVAATITGTGATGAAASQQA